MQTNRVTLIGWVGLAVSVIAAASVYCFVWLLSRSDVGVPQLGQYSDLVSGSTFWLALLGIPAAITLNLVAGRRGRGNLIAGLVGGIVLLLPIGMVFVVVA